MKSIVKASVLFTITALFLCGCAAHYMVAPTIEELNAVTQYKRKVAVIVLSDKGSQIKGVGEIATAELESQLSRQFSLIERQRIAQVIAERNFAFSEDATDMAALGKLLGVDYLIFGNAACSFSAPRSEHSSHTDKKGNFHGSVWQEQNVQSDVAIKMVDVSNGLVVFADKRSSNLREESDRQNFSHQAEFDQNIKMERVLRAFAGAAGHVSKMDKVDLSLVTQGLESAVSGFRDALTRQFPHKGQILQKVSETEVLVNLGSAYGVQPGDTLVVYWDGPAMIDPNTGIDINRKAARVLLTVQSVTSGISSIAKGRKADILGLQIGTEVSTFGGR